MPVAVLGMHRSGTSMLMRMLAICGLDVGPESELLPGNEFNPDGYWENRRLVALNDRLLEFLGGAWDLPPSPSDGQIGVAVEAFRAHTQTVLEHLHPTEPWGWKDPRTTLTLRFWQALFPDLRVVLCVRNPTEVALSLQRRGAMSPALAMDLWVHYNREALRAAGSGTFVLTHYESYFTDAKDEFVRVLDALGLEAAEGDIEKAVDVIGHGRRHHDVGSTSEGPSAVLPSAVSDLYATLRAGGSLSGHSAAALTGGREGIAPRVGVAEEAAGLAGYIDLLQERDRWKREAARLRTDRDHWRREGQQLSADLEAARRAADDRTHERDHARSEADRTAAELAALQNDLGTARAGRDAARAERDATASDLQRVSIEHGEARLEIERLREERDRYASEIRGLVETVGELTAQRDILRADLERVRDERDVAQADAGRRGAEHEEARAALDDLLGRHETARRRVEHLTRQLKVAESRLQRLELARESGLHTAERLRAERSNARRALIAAEAERDRWHAESDRLANDRDRWQSRAEKWITEAKRLREADARRLSQRLRRATPRRVAGKLLRRQRPSSKESAQAALPPARRADQTASSARDRISRLGRATSGSVSVVIPTLNAGPDFERVLSSLRSQRGVAQLEIVVADSGSTDGTPQTAARFGARVMTVPAGQFGHGRTRNMAAGRARGEILLMMVQDAFLLGHSAIAELVDGFTADPELAAISARQVARSDADMYGAYVVWAHGFSLAEARKALNGAVDFEALAPIQRRAMAPVDDVCCAVRRTVWKELGFADVDFAEDLDFGLRAVRQGWRVALSDSVAVAHSHTRDSVYHLRRSVADRLRVAPLVGDDRLTPGSDADVASLLAAGRVIVAELAGTIDARPDEPSSLRRWLSRAVEPPRGAARPSGGFGALDAFLAASSTVPARQAVIDGLRTELTAALTWPPLTRFATAQRSVDRHDAAEFVAKLVGSVLGRVVGDSIRRDSSQLSRHRLLEGV